MNGRKIQVKISGIIRSKLTRLLVGESIQSGNSYFRCAHSNYKYLLFRNGVAMYAGACQSAGSPSLRLLR